VGICMVNIRCNQFREETRANSDVDGGEAVTLYLNGKEICVSKAEYGGAGGTMKAGAKEWTTISKMSDCLEPVAVKKGDYLRLEASYDTIKHPL
jgi:hypothetical protein